MNIYETCLVPGIFISGIRWVFFFGGIRKIKIVKFLNNDAALVLDEKGRELVAMGKGFAHLSHKNEEISRELIDKIFILDDRSQLAQYTQLFSEIPGR